MADVISCPVNGAGPVDVLMQDPPAGAYLGVITAAARHKTTKAGVVTTSIETSVSIVEDGPAQGMSSRIYIGEDWSKKFNVGHFVNLFVGICENAGRTAEEIKSRLAGVIELPFDQLPGKKVFIVVKPAPEELDAQGRRQFSDKNFVTKAQYEQAKKIQATIGIAAPAKKAAGPVPTPADAFGAPAPAANGAGPTPNGTGPTPPVPTVAGAAAGASLGDLFGAAPAAG